MDTAAQILLLIVSGVLALFLLVAIIAIIRIIKLVRTLQHIAQEAEKLAHSAESVGEFFAKSTGPMVVGRFVANVVESVVSRKRK